MKRLIIALFATVIVVPAAFAQGQVYFSTKIGTEVDAPVTAQNTGSGLGRLGWNAQLYLAQNGSLAPLLPITTFQSPGSGADAIADRYVVPVTVDVPQVAPGNSATFVMRVWPQSYASYEEAVAGGSGGFTRMYGESAPVTIASLGGGLLPPSNLVGLQGFAVPYVPEPSPLALASCGAAILALARTGRRRSRA